MLILKAILRFAEYWLRGGNWNNGANAGVFALNLNNAPSNMNTNVGARCCAGMLALKAQARRNPRPHGAAGSAG